MRISKEEVLHIASLVRIAMTDEDVDQLQGQLSNILEQFEVLSTIDTESVLPTAHPIELTNVFKDDVSSPSLSKEDVLLNAPLREEDYLRVKAILEE